MPEYVLAMGDSDAAKVFAALDLFTRAYIEAAFWTECNSDSDDMADAEFAELSDESLGRIIVDCLAFQEMASADLQLAYNCGVMVRRQGYDESSAGHDFWLTRNGHGAGFWDRGFGDLRTDTIGGRLSAYAKSFGASYLYRGGDGKIHVE